jgi:hypothetical protein
MTANAKAHAQPPGRDVACNDGVRISQTGELPDAAAVACSDLLADKSLACFCSARNRLAFRRLRACPSSQHLLNVSAKRPLRLQASETSGNIRSK